jgi:hypothetical protein
MAPQDEASKLQTLAKLAESRAEIRRVLEPRPRLFQRTPGGPQTDAESASREPHEGVFPRSHTMRLLMSGRGLGTVGAVVAGLVMARPALALKLLRMLPLGTVARVLMLKAVTAFRAE